METTLSLLFKGNSGGAVTAVNELTEALERLGKAGGSVNLTAESVKKKAEVVEKATKEAATATDKATKDERKALAEARKTSAERIALAEREVIEKKKTVAELKKILDEELGNESLTEARLLAIRKKSIAAGDALEKQRLTQVQSDSAELAKFKLKVATDEAKAEEKAGKESVTRVKQAGSQRHDEHVRISRQELELHRKTQSERARQAELEVAQGKKTKAELAKIYDEIVADSRMAISERAVLAKKSAEIGKAEERATEQHQARLKSLASSANTEARREIADKIALIDADQRLNKSSRAEAISHYTKMLDDARLYNRERVAIARQLSRLMRDEVVSMNSGNASTSDRLRIRQMGIGAYQQAGQTAAQFGRDMSYGVGLPITSAAVFSAREFGNFEKKQGSLETALTLGGEKNYSRQRLDKMILNLSTSSIGLPIEDIQDIALQGVQAGVGQEKLEGYIQTLYKLKLLIPDVRTEELAEKFNKLMVSSGNDLEMATSKMMLESARLATIGTMSAAGSKEVLSASTRISGGISNLGGSTTLTYALAGAGTGAGLRPEAYSTQINKLSTMLLRSKESFKEKTGGDSALKVIAGLVYGGKDFGPADIATQKRLLTDLERDVDGTYLKILEKLRSMQQGRGSTVAVYDALGIKGRDGVRSFFTLGNLRGDKTPSSFYEAASAVTGEKVEQQVEARQGESLQKYQLMVNRLREIAIELGQTLKPVAKDIVDVIKTMATALGELIKEFNKLPESSKKAIITGAAVLAALGPVITVLGNGVSLISGGMSAANKFAQWNLARNAAPAAGSLAAGLAGASPNSAALSISRFAALEAAAASAAIPFNAWNSSVSSLIGNLGRLKGIGVITIQLGFAVTAADWILKLLNRPGVLETIQEGGKAWRETHDANSQLRSTNRMAGMRAVEQRSKYVSELKKLEESGPQTGRYAERKARLQQLIAGQDKIIAASKPAGATAPKGIFSFQPADEFQKTYEGFNEKRTFTPEGDSTVKQTATDRAQDAVNQATARLAKAQAAVNRAYADIDFAFEKDKSMPSDAQKKSLLSLLGVQSSARIALAQATAQKHIATGLDEHGVQLKPGAAGSYSAAAVAVARRDNEKSELEFRKKMEAYHVEELEVKKKEIAAAKENLKEELKTLRIKIAGEKDLLSKAVLINLAGGIEKDIAGKDLYLAQLAAQQAQSPLAMALAGKAYGNEIAGIDLKSQAEIDAEWNSSKQEEIKVLEARRKKFEEGTAAYDTLTENIERLTDSLRNRSESEKEAEEVQRESNALNAERNRARRRQADFEMQASMLDPSQEAWLNMRRQGRLQGALAIEPNESLVAQIMGASGTSSSAELMAKARNPQALSTYLSGTNAADDADKLTQLMSRINLFVEAFAHTEGQGGDFAGKFLSQARQGVALPVKDSDKAGVIKSLSALLTEGYQSSSGLFGKSGSLNLGTYMSTMSSLRDIASPFGPKGANAINDEMGKAVKEVMGAELDKTLQLSRQKRGGAIDELEKYLTSLPRWTELPLQLKDEFTKTFFEARKALAALDPRRIAARQAESEIRGALIGQGKGMLDRLFNPIEGSVQEIGFGPNKQRTHGADQQWGEFWKTGVKTIKTSLANGIWDGAIQPEIDKFVSGFSGALAGFLAQWQGSIGQLAVGLNSLALALGAGGKKKQGGALLGGALGFLAGSLIPGLGNMAGAQIGASAGAAWAGGGGIGGALAGGAAAYGGLSLQNLGKPGTGGIRDLGDGTVVVSKGRAAAISGGPQVSIVQNIRNEDKSSARFYTEGMTGMIERELASLA